MDYDVIVIGSGPGGYVAAIRASQLKMRTAVVEKAELGGICLNWGCIPTKSLLKSAQVFDYVNHAADYGIVVDGQVKPDFSSIVSRSRKVAEGMSKGVNFLLKKNKIEQIQGTGRLAGKNRVEVEFPDGTRKIFTAGRIILATGARSKDLPNLKQDGRKIIGYREAMTLSSQPGSMIIVGSGAIGSEFASFYQTIGTEVTLVEFLPRIVPNEDEEVSKQLERAFKKLKMRILTGSTAESADTSGEKIKAVVKTPSGEEVIEADIILSAVGVTSNIEDLGLEDHGVKTEKGKVVTDEYYRTTAQDVYAIGDITEGQALAHVASAEAVVCVEKMAGLDPEPVDYNNIPACTYTNPEIASCGYTEAAARDAGFDIKVGKFPFTASGKASASGSKDGFVKLIFDSAYGELLGAHMIGANVTELIGEIVTAAIMEAAAAAYGEVIHL